MKKSFSYAVGAVIGIITIATTLGVPTTEAYTNGKTYLAANSDYVYTHTPILAGSIPAECSDVRIVISNDAYYDTESIVSSRVYEIFDSPRVSLTSDGNWTLDLGSTADIRPIPFGIYHVDIISKCGNPSYADPKYADRYVDSMHVYPYACYNPYTQKTDCAPMHRFYNPSNGGAHFYTVNEGEKRQVAQSWFIYEGITGFVQLEGGDDTTEIYRFYKFKSGTHLYTTDLSGEATRVIDTMTAEYKYEPASKFRVYPIIADKPAGTVTVHRFYNRLNGTHFYTTSENEYNQLISQYGIYQDEGNVFYLIGLE